MPTFTCRGCAALCEGRRLRIYCSLRCQREYEQTQLGALWLATVPLTSGLVAHLWGLRYMGTLYGFVFLSHQIGSFLGVWLGGTLYDLYGDYTVVWWVGVGVGAFSALIHLPIREDAPRAVAVPA